jgi:hypothetical protein
VGRPNFAGPTKIGPPLPPVGQFFSHFAYSLKIKNRLQQNLKLVQHTLQIVWK